MVYFRLFKRIICIFNPGVNRNVAIKLSQLQRFATATKTFYTCTNVGIAFTLPLFLKKQLESIDNLQPDSTKAKLKEADDLYDNQKFDELYDLLHELKESESDEILWRLARVTFEKSKLAKEKADNQRFVKEAFEHIKNALNLNADNYAVHKWMAILLDAVSKFDGYKARVDNAMKGKYHMERAIELNPDDATSYFLLGYWFFSFADLTFAQKKLADMLFGPTPNATYDDALNYFEKAEEVQPNFYSTNLLMIGKIYMKTSRNEKALEYLKRVRDFDVKTKDDKQAHKEALDLLQKLNEN